MNISNDPNLWAIVALAFLLGLLIGIFLTAGGRRKWKARYKAEQDKREALERERDEREKEWRERDSLRGAAVRSPVDERSPI